jgi:hypothetical protein
MLIYYSKSRDDSNSRITSNIEKLGTAGILATAGTQKKLQDVNNSRDR